jgi:Membrane domain of glycerophosphoryl diester phosphodiesterase
LEGKSGPGVIIGRMGVGEVLDAGVTLTRRNYRRLIEIAAWAFVPAYALLILVSATTSQTIVPGVARFLSPSPGGIFVSVGNLLVTGAEILAGIALAAVIAHVIDPTSGRSFSEPGRLYRFALGRLPSLIVLGIVIGLAAVPLLIVFPLGVYVLVRWAVSWNAVIIEQVGALEGLKRSWELTKGSWWHTFLVVVGGAIIFGIVAFALGAFLGLVAGAVGALVGNRVLVAVLDGVASGIATILVLPFSIAYGVVLYYELRARTEGFDLQQRAAQVAGGE